MKHPSVWLFVFMRLISVGMRASATVPRSDPTRCVCNRESGEEDMHCGRLDTDQRCLQCMSMWSGLCAVVFACSHSKAAQGAHEVKAFCLLLWVAEERAGEGL